MWPRTSSSHYLCTTSHVSQALETQSIKHIEDILQTWVCSFRQSGCIKQRQAQVSPWVSQKARQSFPDAIYLLGGRGCSHLLCVWTQVVNGGCLTWTDLGQAKPAMWAKISESWGAESLCLHLNLFLSPLTSVWWPFNGVHFKFLPQYELIQICGHCEPCRQFLLRHSAVIPAQ